MADQKTKKLGPDSDAHNIYALPASYRLYSGVRKRILRDAFADALPPQIVTRGKMGFLLPIRRWFRDGRLRAELEGKLSMQQVVQTIRCCYGHCMSICADATAWLSGPRTPRLNVNGLPCVA